MSIETLSFTIRPVQTHEDLLRACEVRAIAYGQKIPAYRESMLVPDAVDQLPATGIYLCEDKLSGAAVGTMRIQVTRPGLEGLAIEKYVATPPGFENLPRAEVTRLSAVPGADPFVRLALWKTSYLHCRQQGVHLLMIAVRKPALIRAYERMGAKDICSPIPLPYAGDLVHRIMAIDLQEADAYWRESAHPMLRFMVETRHPDIKGFDSMHGAVPMQEQVVRVFERHGKVE